MLRADGQAAHGFELREAVASDAAALAELNAASWRAAYADILPAAFLADLDVAAWEERLRARIAQADGARFTLVAWAHGRRLGLVSGGPARDEPTDAGEVCAVYVQPELCGGGFGSALLTAAEKRLAAGGFSRAMLWVFTRNRTARRFYESRGWRAEPARAYWQRDGLRRQLACYSKRLAAAYPLPQPDLDTSAGGRLHAAPHGDD